MSSTNDLSLGKFGKQGQVDIENQQLANGGIRKEDVDKKFQALFSSFDSDGNNVLTQNEIAALKQQITTYAKNGKDSIFSNKDAEKLIENNEILKQNNVKAEDLFQFIQTLEAKAKSSNVISSTVDKDGNAAVAVAEGNKEVTKKYSKEDGKQVLETVTVTKDDEGNAQGKSVERDGLKENYTYINGKEYLSHRFENEGTENERVTEIKYDDKGQVASQTVRNNTSEETKKQVNGELRTTHKVENSNDPEKKKETSIEYNEDGGRTEIVTDKNGTVTNVYDKDNHKVAQKKVSNGKVYSLNYDDKGNITGVIVQYGETIDSMCKKFGCSKEEFLEANKNVIKKNSKGTPYLPTGSSVKIPDKDSKLSADNKVFRGRKSSKGAIAEEAKVREIKRQQAAKAAQIKAQRAAENKVYKQLGIQNRKGAGKKIKDSNGCVFTIVGKAAYARTIAKDRKGNIHVISWDKKDLKTAYVASYMKNVRKGKKAVVVGGRTYFTDGKAIDRHGRMKVTHWSGGRSYTLSGGKSKTNFKDRVILNDSYVESSNARDYAKDHKQEGAHVTLSGGAHVTQYTDSKGKVWYWDEKTGKALVKDQHKGFVQREAKAISDMAYEAAHGIGTDTDKLKKATSYIKSKEIFRQVNANIAPLDSDYKPDGNTTAFEKLVLDEVDHGTAQRDYFAPLIYNGVMTTNQAANCISRELSHEMHGRLFGYTSTEGVNRVMNMCDRADNKTSGSNRALRLAVEKKVKQQNPELKADNGSYVRAYIKDDGWENDETDRFDANWVANNSYSHKEDQAHRNAVIGRLCFDYDNKEDLHAGLKAMDENSQDFVAFSNRAKAENKKRGYKQQFSEQQSAQQYLAGRATSDNDVDVEQLSACNTLLYNHGAKPARVQAEESLYGAKKGDMTNVFSSMDPAVYAEQQKIFQKDHLGNCKNLQEAYKKAVAQTSGSERTTVKANALLSGQVSFTQQEKVAIAVELMHSIDSNEGSGKSVGVSASHINDADYQTEQLQSILTNNPEIIADLKARVKKEKFESTSTFTVGGPNGVVSTSSTTDTRKKYLDMLNNTNTAAKEEIFYDAQGKKITNPEQIKALKQANMESLSQFREYVAQLENAYRAGVDEEGALSDAANSFLRYSGIGTDRGDVENAYRQAKRLLQQMELAAQGRLRDGKGHVISVQKLAQNTINAQSSKLEQANSDYKTAVAMTKMGMVLAPVIAVTTVATAGTGSVVWGGVLGAGATFVAEGGLEATELLTSETGNTAEHRAQATQQVMWDSALAGISFGVGRGSEKVVQSALKGSNITREAVTKAVGPQTAKILETVPESKLPQVFTRAQQVSTKIESTPIRIASKALQKEFNMLKKFAPKGMSDTQLEKAAVILARTEAAGFEISSDTAQSLIQMYAQNGQFDEQSFIQGMILSVAGNTLGHLSGAKGDMKHLNTDKPFAAPPEPHKPGVELSPESGDVHAELKPTDVKANDVKPIEGTFTSEEPLNLGGIKPKSGETLADGLLEKPKADGSASADAVDVKHSDAPRTKAKPADTNVPKAGGTVSLMDDFGEMQEVSVASVKMNADGKGYVVTADGGAEITYKDGKPVSMTNNGLTAEFKYTNPDDAMYSGVTVKDKYGKIENEVIYTDDKVIETDYKYGKKYTTSKSDGAISTEYLSPFEYPAGTVDINEEIYLKNIKAQIKQATSTDDLDDLLLELHNYTIDGTIDKNILDMINAKKAELNPVSASIPKAGDNVTIHNPLGDADDYKVNSVKVHKDGTYTVVAEDGELEITYKDNKPVSMKSTFTGYSEEFQYANPSDTTFSGAIIKNKDGQITMSGHVKADTVVEMNYVDGVKTTKSKKDGSVISEEYLSVNDYPSNAIPLDSAQFVKNMEKQIDDCNSLKKINDLKAEYYQYVSKYGSADPKLFGKIQDKAIKLSGTSATPHKPLSNLITNTTADKAFESFNFTKYGKKGMPLKYSHDTFLSDLKSALDSLPDSERTAIMKNLNIKLYDDAFTGLELTDIPTLSATPHSANESKILDILNKYAKHNELLISDPILKPELDKFLKDVPEFTFIIGKKQNSVHQYSLESHTLQNLQKALKYADDANLDDKQKEILKMSIMLHDLGKQFKGSAISDTGHAALSKKYAATILDRFNYSSETKEKILNLIEHHHWFKDYNTGKISAEQVKQMFGDDLPLAQIMAKSDLESVSDTFHLTILEKGKKLSQAEFDNKFQEKMDEITGNVDVSALGYELPIGPLKTYDKYYLDKSKVDKLVLGDHTEVDLNDPKLKQLMNDLKEGESFAIGCTNPKMHYTDVKYQVGKYEDGVGSHHLIITKKNGQFVIEAHKATSVVKDIPTAHNVDPIIDNKIKSLRQGKRISSENFTVNGKPVPFEIIQGTQGGSNKGYYVVNKLTGDLYYAKFGGEQGKAELLANKFYAMAGIDTPEMTSFTASDGTIGTLSKYVPDLTEVKSATPNANAGFGMDVLLANWDVVGLSNDNMLKTSGGKVVRLDTGGCFDYRAKGANKPYTTIPSEFISMIDSSVNPKTAEVFHSMTRDDLIKSLKKVADLKDSDITNLLDSMGMSHYKDSVLGRKQFITKLLDEIKATPQGSDSTYAYMRKIMAQTLDKSVDSAKSVDELNNINQALGFLNDAKLKSSIQDKLQIKKLDLAISSATSKEELQKIAHDLKYIDEGDAKKYLQDKLALQEKNIASNPKIELTTGQVKDKLIASGFVEDHGTLTKPLSSKEISDIYSQYGSFADTVKHKIQYPLTNEDIEKIKIIMNANDGKFLSVWNGDMNTLVLLYRNIESTHIFDYLDEMGPGEWETLVNIAKNPISETTLDNIENYKGWGYSSINKALEEKHKHGVDYSSFVADKIKDIQAYLNTQVIHHPITIKRNEGFEVLNSIKLPNGESLGDAMESATAQFKASKKTDKTKINEVKKMVLGQVSTAHQEHFMSASIAGPAPFESKPVHWTLEVQAGSKGVLLEGINLEGGLQNETEILMQKDSKLTIKSIDYNEKQGFWEVHGTLQN